MKSYIDMINKLKRLDTFEVKEWAFQFPMAKFMFMLYSLAKYAYHYYFSEDIFSAVSASLRYERIVSTCEEHRVSHLVQAINERIIQSILFGNIQLLKSFLETREAKRYREEFLEYGDDCAVRLKYPKKHDYEARQGDLLVLKPYMGSKEKGVLLVQYNDAFKKLAAIFDLYQLSKRYRLVLEPSTWGYRDSVFFLYLGLDTDVIIEAQHEEDYKYIKHLGHNIHAIRLGAGDWVDPNIFTTDETLDKVYDIVMVASWLRLKRHWLLFKAVSEIRSRIGKIALIGYPVGGRTIDQIREEAMKYGIGDKLFFFENISPEYVNKVIQQSRIGVMLSKREGANKGIYECLFCNVPVILTAHNIGVNRSQINKFTGVVAKDSELSDKILYLLDNIYSFSPRTWAYDNTGYMNSHVKLNNMLINLAKRSGEEWTVDIYRKKNATNAMYADEIERLDANLEFDRLVEFLYK
jgi:glycosyltransferase involved in cell wall biosynthesis